MRKKLLLILSFLLFFIPVSVLADTLTVYPDPDTESTSVDGHVGESASDATWATIHGAAGSVSDDSSDRAVFVYIDCDGAENRFRVLYRSIFLFDTSPISDAATLDSAVLSLWGKEKGSEADIDVDAVVVSSDPASNIALENGDYDSLGTIAFSNVISYASWDTAGYNDFTLNASGESAVDFTGVSKFGIRDDQYDRANVEPTWDYNSGSFLEGYFADQTGTDNDPKLVITYTVAKRRMIIVQ